MMCAVCLLTTITRLTQAQDLDFENATRPDRSSYKTGGLPVAFETARLKSGKSIIVIRQTANRSKLIFKLLDFDNGQPIALVANQHVVTSLNGREEATVDEFVKLATEVPSFVIEVNPLEEKKIDLMGTKKIIVITTKVASDLDVTSADQLTVAYNQFTNEAKCLLRYQNSEATPLSFRLARAGNHWHQFDRKDELLRALSVVDAGRKRLEAILGALSKERERLEVRVEPGEKLNLYVKELDLVLLLHDLRLYEPLYKELMDKERRAEQLAKDLEQLALDVQAFRAKIMKQRQAELNKAILELEAIQSQHNLLASQQEFALNSLALEYSFAKQEIDDYNSWAAAENASIEEELEREYFSSIDYGGNWNNLQLMHQTGQMQFNSFYRNNWDHRAATDGRQ